MKINPSILAYINNDPAANEGADPLQAKALVDSRSFCERTIIEDFLRLCDIPGISPQWCIDEIQRNLQAECGNQYSCLITENDPSTVASLHDYRGRSEKYYAICGDVTNREINTSKLQSACLSAFGNCWDNEQTADCMKNFLYGREDDEIYQYCPDGDNNVLVALTEKEIKIASQNPDGNTGRNNQMPYQCVAYCTGGSEFVHPIIETCNDEGIRPPAYECAIDNSCGEHAECVLDDDFNESCICTLGFEYIDNDCQDIDECENGTHECGSGQCFNLEGTYRCNTAVDVVWVVDGTGSYTRNIAKAQVNFREQIEYFKSKGEEGLEFRMGLTFFSDRFFAIDEMTDALYHCALPLTDIASITDIMVTDAFASISQMYYGGDGPEDVLMGVVFSRTDPTVGWYDESVKQIHVFTDNPFHYYGDGSEYGRTGGSIPPLQKWTIQPADLYKFYDKTVVSAFTRGCEWDGECGPDYRDDWALDQIFFNLVSCNGACKQLYVDTFDTVPTELAEWTPSTGLVDTTFSRSILSSNSIEQSFNKLTEELDLVMNDTLTIVEYNKCLIPDGECQIPAECVQSINGQTCECNDLEVGIGFECTCFG